MQVIMDTSTVIGVMERRPFAARMRNELHGTSYGIVLCRQTLTELQRVRKWPSDEVLSALRRIFGEKRVSLREDPDNLDAEAASLRRRCALVHRGDDKILAMCSAFELGLVTNDSGMLAAAKMMGLRAFHARHAGAFGATRFDSGSTLPRREGQRRPEAAPGQRASAPQRPSGPRRGGQWHPRWGVWYRQG